MKKSYMMGIALSLSILTSFVPAGAAQSARQRAYQAWQRTKEGASKAASFAGRHKGKIATAALVAAGVAAGAYGGVHRLLPKKGWYIVGFKKEHVPGTLIYIHVEKTDPSQLTVTYSMEMAFVTEHNNVATRQERGTFENVPLKNFNASYPHLTFIGDSIYNTRSIIGEPSPH